MYPEILEINVPYFTYIFSSDGRSEMIAGRPGVNAAAAATWRVWEEVNATKLHLADVPEYQMSDQLAAKRIMSGDVFCFADAVPQRLLVALTACVGELGAARRARAAAERALRRAEENARRVAVQLAATVRILDDAVNEAPQQAVAVAANKARYLVFFSFLFLVLFCAFVCAAAS